VLEAVDLESSESVLLERRTWSFRVYDDIFCSILYTAIIFRLLHATVVQYCRVYRRGAGCFNFRRAVLNCKNM